MKVVGPMKTSQTRPPRSPKFAYRRNPDASTDSICLTCYRTAARAVLASELARLECQHQCEIDPLREAGTDRAAASSKPSDASSC